MKFSSEIVVQIGQLILYLLIVDLVHFLLELNLTNQLLVELSKGL